MVMVYYSEKVQVKISKGKGPGEIRQEILTVLSPWSPTDR